MVIYSLENTGSYISPLYLRFRYEREKGGCNEKTGCRNANIVAVSVPIRSSLKKVPGI
jgi:hypothetical protein